jgi:molybdopterin synthase catalytic subunit
LILITDNAIDLSKILIDVSDNSAGAITLFVGTVRDRDSNVHVSALYYEAYKKMAEDMMTEIEKEVLRKWNIIKFSATHRIGTLKVSEISVAVAVSSEHRNEAFEACKYGIDNIKTRVPIWKKEYSEAGDKWVTGVSLHE